MTFVNPFANMYNNDDFVLRSVAKLQLMQYAQGQVLLLGDFTPQPFRGVLWGW